MTYKIEAITSTIRATSRASVKIGDSYYTVEYSEERVIPQIENIEAVNIVGEYHTETLGDIDIEKERQNLWDTVNSEVDGQIEDILKTFK